MGKWDKYVVPDSVASKWDKYAVEEEKPQAGFQVPGPLGQELDQAISRPSAQFERGIRQLGRNPIAGAGNMALGAVGALATPITAAVTAARQVPFLREAVDVAGGVLGFGEPIFREGTKPLVQHLDPASQQEIVDVAGQFGGLLTGAALTGGGIAGVRGFKNRKGGPAVRAEMSGRKKFGQEFPAATKELGRSEDLSRMASYLGEQERISPVTLGDRPKGGFKPSVATQLAKDKFPNIKQRIFGETQEVVQRNANATLVGGVEKIAGEIESLRNIFTKNIDVLKDKSVLDEAAKYKNLGTINLSQASEMLHSINASLKEFYNKSAESQAAAEAAVKPIAEMEKAASSIREQIGATIRSQENELVSEWYVNKMRDYGAAARLEAAVERNISRFENPPPPWITTKSSTIYPSQAGTRLALLEHTVGKIATPDRTARSAMQKFSKVKRSPAGVPQQSPSVRAVSSPLLRPAFQVGPELKPPWER